MVLFNVTLLVFGIASTASGRDEGMRHRVASDRPCRTYFMPTPQ
jgi:hypothetical protein